MVIWTNDFLLVNFYTWPPNISKVQEYIGVGFITYKQKIQHLSKKLKIKTQIHHIET
jgi:hypothetical protein